MSISNNKVVSINYTLKDEEGNIVDTTENSAPFSFITGQQQILPKLEEKIVDMEVGSEEKVELQPEDAYGKYNLEAVRKINKQEFPEGTPLEEGMSFMADTPDGKRMPFVIKNVEEQNVTVDFNHPLAGKSLEFDLKLVEIRDATTEELEHGHVHGPGGHQH